MSCVSRKRSCKWSLVTDIVENMKKLCILPILVSLIYLPDCVVIHSKADTILTLFSDTKNEASMTLGFRDTAQAFVDDRLTIIGRGCHPREHETYALPTTVEDQGILFRGTLRNVEWNQGKTCRLHLDKVLVSSPHHKIRLLSLDKTITWPNHRDEVDQGNARQVRLGAFDKGVS